MTVKAEITSIIGLKQQRLVAGLYFIPAFFGIQTPLNDDTACCGFLGIRPDTTKEQLVRAMLESIAFRIYQIWSTVIDEIGTSSTGFVRCLSIFLSFYIIFNYIITLFQLLQFSRRLTDNIQLLFHPLFSMGLISINMVVRLRISIVNMSCIVE